MARSVCQQTGGSNTQGREGGGGRQRCGGGACEERDGVFLRAVGQEFGAEELEARVSIVQHRVEVRL